ARASQCCTTTRTLLRWIRQNRSGDKPTRTPEPGPVEVGPSVQPGTVRPAPHGAADRADQHRRPRPGATTAAPARPGSPAGPNRAIRDTPAEHAATGLPASADPARGSDGAHGHAPPR